jgi:hypothetical protein
MRLASPKFTLISLLAAAVLVLGSGWWLARRSVEKHIPPDRAVLRELATQLQRELLQLEALFQADMRELAEGTTEADEARIRALCDNLYGVVQFSRLGENRDRGWHLPIHPDSEVTLPVPVLPGATPLSIGDNTIVLPPEDVSPTGDAPDFGWFAGSDPRYWIIWKRPDNSAADVFLIDHREIVARVDSYLRQWIGKSSAAARAVKGLYRLETPTGGTLAGLSEPVGRDPEMVLPLVCRLGDWQLVAWDQIATHTFYDPATLALTFIIAAALAILGLILFLQQKRTARLAEQRVSFVNRVSHELGAPLTNILLNLDLVEDNPSLPDPVRERLRLVNEEARRLSRLVCNVLTFSRRERDRLKLSSAPHVPDEIVDAVLQQFQPALERRGIETQWRGAAKSA